MPNAEDTEAGERAALRDALAKDLMTQAEDIGRRVAAALAGIVTASRGPQDAMILVTGAAGAMGRALGVPLADLVALVTEDYEEVEVREAGDFMRQVLAFLIEESGVKSRRVSLPQIKEFTAALDAAAEEADGAPGA